jgi:hypothetical protein
MKKSLAFLLISAVSLFVPLHACWYYPSGEEIRFCFFYPGKIGYDHYQVYHYTSEIYNSPGISEYDFLRSFDSLNCAQWQRYCGGKLSIVDVRETVYHTPVASINSSSDEVMLKYLYAAKDYEAINYLIFAKNVEALSSLVHDPWERQKVATIDSRTAAAREALAKSLKCKSPDIRDRYLFQAIKLNYYGGNGQQVVSVYNNYFAARKHKNIFAYWGLYFRAIQESNPVLENFYLAQVFANTPDKREALRPHYDRSIAVQEMLAYAKTDAEKSNVWLMDGARRIDMALENIKKVYHYSPGSDGVEFLLLREINKVEDWILTPQYSLFFPSLRQDDWENATSSRILQRVEVDRMYARKLLAFVQSADLTKVNNPDFWKVSKAYLLFLVNDYNKALEHIRLLEKTIKKNNPLYDNLRMTKGLCLTAAQGNGKAVILKEVEPMLREYGSKYCFAIGKELEKRGNTTDAALLFSNIVNNPDYGYNAVLWKTAKLQQTYYYDFYTEYLTYLDAAYTSEQMETLMLQIENAQGRDAFSVWKYAIAKKDKDRLYDLLGMKYMRENRLPEAYVAFNRMAQKTDKMFDANPFYDFRGTPNFVTRKEKMKLTKADVTRNLIKFLARAQSGNEKNKDYYYFIAANCYYNMTYNGNSWMMRRIHWSTDHFDDKLPDKDEYNQCLLAKKYYKLAYDNAKTDEFRALCLRFMAKCEGDQLRYLAYKPYQYTDIDSENNDSYTQLYNDYPDYADQLTGSCEYFDDYFKSRR